MRERRIVLFPNDVERRAAARINVPFIVFVAGWNDAGAGFRTETRVLDVSISGVSVGMRESVRVGSLLHIKINFTTALEGIDTAAGVVAEGEVVRLEGQSDEDFKVAIRFLRYVDL